MTAIEWITGVVVFSLAANLIAQYTYPRAFPQEWIPYRAYTIAVYAMLIFLVVGVSILFGG